MINLENWGRPFSDETMIRKRSTSWVYESGPYTWCDIQFDIRHVCRRTLDFGMKMVCDWNRFTTLLHTQGCAAIAPTIWKSWVNEGCVISGFVPYQRFIRNFAVRMGFFQEVFVRMSPSRQSCDRVSYTTRRCPPVMFIGSKKPW